MDTTAGVRKRQRLSSDDVNAGWPRQLIITKHEELADEVDEDDRDLEMEHSSDDDFSPGQLVIDTADSDVGSPGGSKSSASTPTKMSSSSTNRLKTPVVVTGNTILGEQDFKGLTFVGKLDVVKEDGSLDTICLYSYHWGNTTVDIITMCNADTVVPMKTVYGRIVPGLTRNAVSNRVPKIGAKTIALSDAHIAVLKKLQLPITARSHYLTVSDFIKVCQYYGRTPPRNLANFVYITSRHNPAEILKSFNTQSPVFPAPSMGAPQGGGVGANMSMATHTQDARSGLLPDPMSAEDQAPGYPTLAMRHSWHHSVSEESLSDLLSPTVSEASQVEVHTLTLPHGRGQLTLILRDSCPYFLNGDLQMILPQAHQNVMTTIRSLLDIPLEYATRVEMGALKSAGAVGTKAGRVILYKVADVAKMFSHWRVPIPYFMEEILNGKVPAGELNTTPLPLSNSSGLIVSSSQPYPSFTAGYNRIDTPRQAPPPYPIHGPAPSSFSPNLMSPSGTRLNFDQIRAPGKQPTPLTPAPISHSSQQKQGSSSSSSSHISAPPLDDSKLDYNYIPWGATKSLTLLCPPDGEPHVAIAELVDKVFEQRSQVSMQRRIQLNVTAVPATSLQIHALRARGSIDPSAGYSKLVPLSGMVVLATAANITVPDNILQECQKHIQVPVESLLHKKPSSSPVHPTNASSSPSVVVTSDSTDHEVLSLHAGPPPLLTSDATAHPDVIPLGRSFRNADGLVYQVNWGKAKIAIFTSTRNITYCSLFQIYEEIFKELVTRMNFKMRMRKLQVKSIRAPSSVRLCLIKVGALPSSSPVCGLIRIPEMESLAKSYDLTPPPVFYDLFLKPGKEPPTYIPSYADGEGWGIEPTGSFVYSENALVVSVPLASINSQSLWTDSNSQTHPQSSFPANKSTSLQSLAKKISQKNHRLAAISSSSEAALRNCPACGHVSPLLKKRCQYCGVFFVGRRCQQCGTLNHNRSSNCLKCHSPMESSGRNHPNMQNAGSDQPMNGSPGSDDNDELLHSEDHHSGTTAGPSLERYTSPVSPTFATPPIRSAALKSMFPDELSKSRVDEGSVLTKTVYSGNLSSSRKCQECSTLNSKMAKKCVQCRSPLQGRPCPRCSRPNHNHSTECYKCGAALPSTTTKWVIGNKIYRSSQDTTMSSAMKKAVDSRAPLTCIRCRRLRNQGKLRCGRCGDIYFATPLVDATEHHQPPQEISEEDGVLLKFAQNLLAVGVGGHELLPSITDVEADLRDKLYPAEEEFESVEQEYQLLQQQVTDRETKLADLKVEVDRLIVVAEQLNSKLSMLSKEEEEARCVVESHPDKIAEMEQRLAAIEALI